MKACTNCDSDNVKWGMYLESKKDIPINRLNLHDVSVSIAKHCEDCGEQLEVIPGINNYDSPGVSAALELLAEAVQ